MKLMQKIVMIVLVGMGLSVYADLKVGVVNVQTVFEQAPQGQATVKTLQTALAPQVDQLKSEQASLSTAMSDFNRNAPTMTAKARAAQEQQLSSQQQQFQQDVTNLKNTETQKQQAAAGVFQTDLVNAIGQVAKSGGYDMVMTDQTIPFYNASFDVTAQVVAIMQKSGHQAK